MHHTKPGIVGQAYPPTPSTASSKTNTNKEQNPRNNENSSAVLQVTAEQRRERETIYKKEWTRIMETQTIPEDELKLLVDGLELVKMNVIYDDADVSDYNWLEYNSPEVKILRKRFVDELVLCIERWLKKLPYVTKRNIAPFTVTGDINDAQFPMPMQNKDPWWVGQVTECFDTSSAEDYYRARQLYTGSWFTPDEAQDYFEKFIAEDRRLQMTTEISKSQFHKVSWAIISEGEIGTETKTIKEIKQRNELDDPNKIWPLDPDDEEFVLVRKRKVLKAFIEQKKQNTIKLQELCVHNQKKIKVN
ncbi:unnamed protein product [Didymodactylos carnosus]|uniref:Uncharacterized protein n=1 Tax=Didymodactylos carnosus TaxID=1234261 RepID=A0A8S2FEZ3_9BILA|nr:unnamed protein product [Didymodactylos carnosus]CAF4242708.1 unnamed protein product [Didymodactylos carnosus]